MRQIFKYLVFNGKIAMRGFGLQRDLWLLSCAELVKDTHLKILYV